jgi:U2 small nuclear ribonucleoprotein A'
MLRLKSLSLANNRIGRIDSQLDDYIPNLATLVLTNNLIQELGDLEPLTKCRKLEYLSLLDNPVTKKKYYRLYIIHKIPSIRVLDFKRVRKTVGSWDYYLLYGILSTFPSFIDLWQFFQEREEAKETFKTDAGEENELAVSIGETKSKTFEVGDGIQDEADHRKSNAPGLSPEEQAKIKVRSGSEAA